MLPSEQHLSNPAAIRRPGFEAKIAFNLGIKSYQREQKFIVKLILVHYKHII
jgi:hypothetical protein